MHPCSAAVPVKSMFLNVMPEGPHSPCLTMQGGSFFLSLEVLSWGVLGSNLPLLWLFHVVSALLHQGLSPCDVLLVISDKLFSIWAVVVNYSYTHTHTTYFVLHSSPAFQGLSAFLCDDLIFLYVAASQLAFLSITFSFSFLLRCFGL